MSQLARMFVVLNFLLAAGFLYSAAMFLGLNSAWKEKHTVVEAKMKQQADEASRKDKEQKTRIDELSKESQSLKEEKSSLSATNATLQKANSDAESDKKTKDSQIAKEQGSVTSANEALKRAQDDLAKRTDEANKLRTDFATAETNERKANDEVNAKKTEIIDLNNKIAELEKTRTDLTAKVDELELVKKVAQDAGVDLTALLTKAPIDAKVIGVDMDMKLVQVNAGAAQKVSRGAVLDIARGSSYIGRIKIDQVYPNSSAGTLTIAAPGQQPQVGDRATNTIN